MAEDEQKSTPDPESPGGGGPWHDETVQPARGTSDDAAAARPREIGGRDGPEPTRYGDWEKNGRCIDF